VTHRAHMACLSVCLSVHLHNLKTRRLNFTKLLCVLPVAVAQSSFDSIAIRYLLLVLRTMGPMGRIKHSVMFKLGLRILTINFAVNC